MTNNFQAGVVLVWLGPLAVICNVSIW